MKESGRNVASCAFFLCCCFLLLGGCTPLQGSSAGFGSAGDADILKRYSNHGVVQDAENKSGFSIANISYIKYPVPPGGGDILVEVLFTNPQINQNKKNSNTVANRFQVVNAEDINVALNPNLSLVTNKTVRKGQQSSEYYSVGFLISPESSKYAVIYFTGISASEAADTATPPSFFIVALDRNKPRVLTEKPLLANGLFK